MRLSHILRLNRTAVSLAQVEPCIFSGIQPTGIPHLGNYFGAIRPWVDLQKKHDRIILSVVDLHSVTIPRDPHVLRENIRDMVAALIACGIDPNKTILFQQSAVSEHAELAWVLSCLTNMNKLKHLPQWQQKSESMKEVPLGLFTYPVLQSADILLYKATEVPVGDDQVMHVDLTRQQARKFNKMFGNLFPIPKAVVGNFKRIRNLKEPESKMSKSHLDSRGRIELTDTPDLVRQKLRKAVSDTNPAITYDQQNRPGVSNLVDIHCAVTNLEPGEACRQSEKLDTLHYKMHVADVVIDHIEPIRQEIERIRNDPGFIDSVLADGALRAKSIASETFSEVKRLVGFI